MTMTLQTALLLLLLLQFKHLLADYFFQTQTMLRNQAQYVHIGRVQHALLHAVLSAVALALISAPFAFLLILSLVEGVVHYHIDWAKGWHGAQTGYSTNDAGYWRAFGLDQFLHQVTYIAMIWAWAVFVASG